MYGLGGVWAWRRKPGALREGRNVCSGDSFNSAPSSLNGSKFPCEVILLHFPSAFSSPPPLYGSNSNTWSLEQGTLVRLEESIRRGRGWCQWSQAKDHKDRRGARVRKERHLRCKIYGTASYGRSCTCMAIVQPSLRNAPVVEQVRFVSHYRVDLWGVSEKMLERTYRAGACVRWLGKGLREQGFACYQEAGIVLGLGVLVNLA